MRLLNWPPRPTCAVLLLTAALAGCSAPGNTVAPPDSATAPVAGAPAAAAPTVASAPPPAAAPAQAAAPTSARPAAPAARPSVGAAPGTTAGTTSPAPAPSAPATRPAPVFTEVTVPSGTTLSIELTTSHASDTSRIEDTVRGVLRRPLLVGGVEIAPVGTAVTGHVTAAEQSARVKGRARLALRFSSIVIDESETAITTASIAREAAGTKKSDAAKIGIGAGAGAVIGAIAGGKKGAVVGGTVGAGAGTGVVLATRGDEVEIAAGTPVTTSLSRPLVVRVRMP